MQRPSPVVVKILKRGDHVLSVKKNRIVIVRRNGVAEVYDIVTDPGNPGFPYPSQRLELRMKVTFGDGSVEQEQGVGRAKRGKNGKARGRVSVITG